MFACASACNSTGVAARAEVAARAVSRPPVDVETQTFAGTPLSGAGDTADVERSDAAQALELDVTLLFVDAAPAGVPVARRARAIVAGGGDEPLRAVAELCAPARELAEADAATITAPRNAQELAHVVEALPRGFTRAVSVVAGATSSPRPRTTVFVAQRVEGVVELAFEIDDPRAAAQRELVLLGGELAVDGPPRAIAWPADVLGLEHGAFVALARARTPADAAAYTAAFARALAAARSAASTAHARLPASDDPRLRERVNALAALELAPNRRAALVFLAGATNADLCGDFALTADDSLVDTFVAELVRANAAESAEDASALGWTLERGAWLFLTARLAANEPLPAPLRGLLARYAGQVARSTGAIEDLVRASTDARSFARRLADENAAYLEDSDPAARVRAFDWLASRASAPAGYDPLAPESERRAALARRDLAK